ncbi:hypothetical protein H6F86_20675 [Phormidium sp. FACHB-592]|nr:hypothetical protein [Phormidium sp. FACHB-592]
MLELGFAAIEGDVLGEGVGLGGTLAAGVLDFGLEPEHPLKATTNTAIDNFW